MEKKELYSRVANVLCFTFLSFNEYTILFVDSVLVLQMSEVMCE